MKSTPQIDRTLTLVVLTLLIGGCFLVLQPFLTAIIWAIILCATIWPLHLRLRDWLKGRSTLAAMLVVVLMAVTVLAPFVIVGITIADNAERVGEFAQELIKAGPPPPPRWVEGLPIIGSWAAATWGSFAHDTARLFEAARQFIEPAKRVLFAGGTTLLGGILQLTLSIFIAFFFLRDGDAIVLRLHAAIDRIAGARGRRLALVAATTVRGVVLGILGTAIAQGVLMAIGLWMAGFTAAPLLGLVTFFLSPVPVGPPLVWIAAGLILLSQGQTGWGIFLFIWGALVVSSVDNFVKPMIISRGSALPFVLVLLGVLGGAVAFGFVGVFLGPVLLAVGYALLKEWAVGAPLASANAGNEDLAVRDSGES
jgi:predicted PurR-regulated permease PerM